MPAYSYCCTSDCTSNGLFLAEKPVTRVRRYNSTLTCVSSGYPAPELVWYQCSGVRDSYVWGDLSAINHIGTIELFVHVWPCRILLLDLQGL